MQVALWALISDVSEPDLQTRLSTSSMEIAHARWLLKNAGIDPKGKDLFQGLEKPLNAVKITQHKEFPRDSDVYWVVCVD